MFSSHIDHSFRRYRYADATFSIVMPIHAFLKIGDNTKQVPLMFVLISGKRRRYYKKVLEEVLRVLPDDPAGERRVEFVVKRHQNDYLIVWTDDQLSALEEDVRPSRTLDAAEASAISKTERLLKRQSHRHDARPAHWKSSNFGQCVVVRWVCVTMRHSCVERAGPTLCTRRCSFCASGFLCMHKNVR